MTFFSLFNGYLNAKKTRPKEEGGCVRGAKKPFCHPDLWQLIKDGPHDTVKRRRRRE